MLEETHCCLHLSATRGQAAPPVTVQSPLAATPSPSRPTPERALAIANPPPIARSAPVTPPTRAAHTTPRIPKRASHNPATRVPPIAGYGAFGRWWLGGEDSPFAKDAFEGVLASVGE